MFDYILNAKGYFFWLLVISVICASLERLFTWRRDQGTLRKELWQDVLFLFINGHYFGLVLAYPAGWMIREIGSLCIATGFPQPGQLHLISHGPVWVQFLVFLVLRDLMEWGVHNLLHRVPWLWQFHKLHHSIVHMDWAGNFRFHWMETIVYSSLTWLPLTALGVQSQILLPIAAVSTLVGHLNHANVRFNYGPLKYIVNSPRMHIWHHDEVMHLNGGQNFGVVLSLWDWIFGTAYMPRDLETPQRLGFAKLDQFPNGLFSRLTYPLSRLWRRARE
jgi:sterol desaturase/sphingolipid hydroxylase (fatty acid hydroxylase superfamily)